MPANNLAKVVTKALCSKETADRTRTRLEPENRVQRGLLCHSFPI
jgi:hypothetical protein